MSAQEIAPGIALLLIAFSLFSAFPAHAATELEFILSCNPIASPQSAHSSMSLHHDLGVKQLVMVMIRLYQRFISTQDESVCNFIPSCSHFGMEAMKKLDFIRAILLTSDRLQRCNGMSTEVYETDYDTGKLIDPLEPYFRIIP